MDFNIITYRNLLDSLINRGYSFQTFTEFIDKPKDKSIVLRHDVDDRKENSLLFAKTLNEMSIAGTFYFRIVPQSFDEGLVKEIAALGHEVGYHYEDLRFAQAKHKAQGTGHRAQGEEAGSKKYLVRSKRSEEEEYEKNLASIAIESFKENLERLRKIVPVTTICMHGNPLSKWDSRLLWKYYDYHDFGITGEPYFDIDFNNVLYLTDTGRRWDGELVSLRDKAQGTLHPASCTLHPAPFPKFHSTFDIINAANEGLLPDKIMMTFHPQRWTDKPMPWLKELVMQNVKNVGKYFLVKRRTILDARHREKG